MGMHRCGIEGEDLIDLAVVQDMVQMSPSKKRPFAEAVEAEQQDTIHWPAPMKIATPMRVRRMSTGADRSVAKGAAFDPVSTSGPSAVGIAAREPSQCTDERALGRATKVAFDAFDRFWVEFLRNREEFGSKGACSLAEQQVENEYGALCSAIVGLLPFTQHEEVGGNRSYDVIEFQGATPPCHRLRGKQDFCKRFANQIAYNRNATTRGRARDAMCAVLSALASRSEHNWLEAEDDMEWSLEALVQTEKFSDRKEAFEALLKDVAARQVRGFFSHALVVSHGTFRLAFGRGCAQPLPASLIITYTLPLTEAFRKMDDDGPLPEMSASWMRRQEFALQDINSGAEPGSREERISADRLRPEPRVRELLLSGEPVVMLDAIAALAPRRLARDNGISEIVKAELVGLLSRCKAEGKTVVFMCGGDDPQILAEKVYLRPPFTDYGLRCGNLRWRTSDAEPWAREKPWCQRVTIGLQLP